MDADLREVVLTDTPPSSFGSPPYFHQTPQGLKPLLVGRSEASHAHEHVSGTAEDAQTVDTKGFHSKTNGNENLDQGDDVLEEPMFPFCEGESLQFATKPSWLQVEVCLHDCLKSCVDLIEYASFLPFLEFPQFLNCNCVGFGTDC